VPQKSSSDDSLEFAYLIRRFNQNSKTLSKSKNRKPFNPKRDPQRDLARSISKSSNESPKSPFRLLVSKLSRTAVDNNLLQNIKDLVEDSSLKKV
jgi:hypothetical protein